MGKTVCSSFACRIPIPNGFLTAYPVQCDSLALTDTYRLQPLEGCILLVYIACGHGCVEIDGQKLFYKGYSILYLRSHCDIYPDIPADATAIHIRYAETLPMPPRAGNLFCLAEDGGLGRYFTLLCRNARENRLGTAYDAAADLFRIWMRFCRQSVQECHTPRMLVQEAAACMREEYAFLEGVDGLAERLGVSKSHLIRMFSDDMGVSPGKYLQAVRLENAKLLLEARDYSLDLIANLCGFSGANYFCKVFRRAEGITPGEYRASHMRPPALGGEDPRLLKLERKHLL